MSRKSVHLALACALVILAGLAWAGLAVAQDTNGNLASQIDALATRAGFTVNGLQRIGEASARPITEGSPSRQIEELLKGYNYIIVHDANGGIHELRILNPRSSTGPVPRPDQFGLDRGAAELDDRAARLHQGGTRR